MPGWPDLLSEPTVTRARDTVRREKCPLLVPVCRAKAYWSFLQVGMDLGNCDTWANSEHELPKSLLLGRVAMT